MLVVVAVVIDDDDYNDSDTLLHHDSDDDRITCVSPTIPSNETTMAVKASRCRCLTNHHDGGDSGERDDNTNA